MKQTRLIMGMPITIEVVGLRDPKVLKKVFDYFREVDARFSPYKSDSELSAVNNGLDPDGWSEDMKLVMRLCEETKQASGGYFDINRGGYIDPSGLVKGWSIANAAELLKDSGYNNFYIEAGGDIQAEGLSETNEPWTIGIRSPFDINKIVKVIKTTGVGVATSGKYLRGDHIYNPLDNYSSPDEVSSLTVMAPNIFEADRFATAAYAMGKVGAVFLSALPGFDVYQIDNQGQALFTPGIEAAC